MGRGFTCGLVHPAVPVTVWHLLDSALLLSWLALFCLVIGQIIYLLLTNRSIAYLHTEIVIAYRIVIPQQTSFHCGSPQGSNLTTSVALGTLLCCHTGCCFFRSHLICFAMQIKSVLPQQQLNKWTNRACITTHSVSTTRSHSIHELMLRETE